MQGRERGEGRVSPRQDYKASVRVAGYGLGWGRVGLGRDVEFQKWKLRLWKGGIHSGRF